MTEAEEVVSVEIMEQRRRDAAQKRRASNRSTVMPRWAVMTATGKNLRIYGHNRLAVVLVLKPAGEKLVHAQEAGCWNQHAGHVRPAWDDHVVNDERKSGIGT